jgi:hypothetical protein
MASFLNASTLFVSISEKSALSSIMSSHVLPAFFSKKPLSSNPVNSNLVLPDL